MKKFENVRSTAEHVFPLEVNIDTVYIRSDIERIDEEGFSGWEYSEEQYSLNEYIEKVSCGEDLKEIK